MRECKLKKHAKYEKCKQTDESQPIPLSRNPCVYLVGKIGMILFSIHNQGSRMMNNH
jgi:hypothetical protein